MQEKSIEEIIEKSEDKIEEYVEFVQNAVKELNSYSEIIEDDYILPERINRCLAYYNRTMNTLIAEEERFLTHKRELQRSFTAWFDKKFIETRDALNGDGRVASKFASKTEIESQTRVDNARQYAIWQDAIQKVEDKARFYSKLIDSWKKEDQMLSNLSANLRTEMKKLNVGSISGGKSTNNRSDLQSKRIPLK